MAVSGHALRRREFGGEPSLLGRLVHVGSADYDVIGVVPAGFSGADLERVDLWVPVTSVAHDVIGTFTGTDPWWRVRNVGWLRMVARVDPNRALRSD